MEKQTKMVKLLKIGRMQIRCHSYMMQSSPTPLTAVGGDVDTTPVWCSFPTRLLTGEKHKQENDPLHPLYEQDPVRKRLKSRHSFLHSVEPLDGSAHTRRLTLYSSHLQTTPHTLSFSPKKSLPPGSSEVWPTWSSLNRLCRPTGTGRCKYLMQKWGFNEDANVGMHRL